MLALDVQLGLTATGLVPTVRSGSRRRVPGVGAVAVVAALGITVAPAVAAASGHRSRPFASLPHLGPAPVRCQLGTDPNCPQYTAGTNYTVESTCGSVNISPHIVNVGQTVTATETETVRQCRVQWGSPPGRLISGCKNGVYNVINPQDVQTVVPPSGNCVWKATGASSYPPDAKAPGGGWDQWEIGYCAFVGCAALASDFYYVLPHKRAISGTVYSGATDVAGNRVGLANAVVQISGPSSGTAATNATGFYNALVDPGTYTVHVAGVAGQAATGNAIVCSPGHISGRDCKISVRGSDGVADFISCGGGLGPDAVRGASAASATGSCPPKVYVKIVGPIANFGTRSGLAIDNQLPNEGPVNFTVPIYSLAGSDLGAPNEVAEKCLSGCANLLVTVVDPQTHKPVVGATVEAKLGKIDTAGFPALRQQGNQFLCTQSADPTTRQCGTTLSGLTTDSDGKLRLIYWAPGEMVPAHTMIDVTARNGQATGSATPTKITVRPYVIFKGQGNLTGEEAYSLKEIVGNPAIGDFLNAAGHKVLEIELKALLSRELIAETVLDAAEGPLGYALVQLVDLAQAWSEYTEQGDLDAAFLRAAGLSEVGLDGPPFDKTVPATSQYFRQQILYGVANVLHAVHGGDLWNVGEAVNRKYGTKTKHQVPDQHVSVQGYEISSCSERNPNCGPGYLGESGIEPRLCFLARWSIGVDDFLCTPLYNPVAWVTSQTTGLDPKLP